MALVLGRDVALEPPRRGGQVVPVLGRRHVPEQVNRRLLV